MTAKKSEFRIFKNTYMYPKNDWGKNQNKNKKLN